MGIDKGSYVVGVMVHLETAQDKDRMQRSTQWQNHSKTCRRLLNDNFSEMFFILQSPCTNRVLQLTREKNQHSLLQAI